MASKDDHGKSSNTTTLIFDLFNNEEILPSHLLPSDSLTKKKREAKKFFEELCYIAILESIQLYNHFLVFIQRMREKNREVNDITQQHFYQKLNLLQAENASIPVPKRLTEKQYKKFQAVKIKIEQTLSFISARLDIVNQAINAEQKRMVLFQNAVNQALEKFTNQWTAHFLRALSDPDFEVKILLELPKGSHQSTKESGLIPYLSITLDKDIYLQLTQKIGDSFSLDKIGIENIHNLVQQKIYLLGIEKILEKQLRKKLIENGMSESMLNQILAQSIETLAHFILTDISHNKTLTDSLEEINAATKSLEQSRMQLLAYEQHQEELLDIKRIAEENAKDIDFILAKFAEQTNEENVNEAHIEEKIVTYDITLNTIANHINNSNDELERMLEQINSAAHEADELLHQLNSAHDETLKILNLLEMPGEVNENKLANYQHTITATLDDIKNKSSKFSEIENRSLANNTPAEIGLNKDSETKLKI